MAKRIAREIFSARVIHGFPGMFAGYHLSGCGRAVFFAPRRVRRGKKNGIGCPAGGLPDCRRGFSGTLFGVDKGAGLCRACSEAGVNGQRRRRTARPHAPLPGGCGRKHGRRTVASRDAAGADKTPGIVLLIQAGFGYGFPRARAVHEFVLSGINPRMPARAPAGSLENDNVARL